MTITMATAIFSVVSLGSALAATSTTTDATTSTVIGTATSTLTSTTTGPIDDNISSIESKLGQLVDIRNNQSISTDTKTIEEITAQKGILNGVVSLSMNEISALQTKLNALPVFATGSEELSLQSNYLAELSSYNEYFTQESAVIASSTTLSQLQTTAASIKTFRDSGYNSETYNMVTFTLLYYDAGIISTAKSRLSSVSSDVANLENEQLLSESSVLDNDVKLSSQLINKASSLYNQANQLILQSSLESSTSTTASSTVIASSTLNLAASATASSTPATAAPDPRTLIEKSVSDVKDAYQIFIEIANNIKAQLDLQ